MSGATSTLIPDPPDNGRRATPPPPSSGASTRRSLLWIALGVFMLVTAIAVVWALSERATLRDTQALLARSQAGLTPTKTLPSTATSDSLADMKPMPNTIEPSKDPINVAEWDRASTILADAGSLIERDGWQQGATGSTEKWCATTALEGAWLQSPYSIVDFNYARDALSRVIGVPSEPSRQGDALTGSGEPAVPYWGINFVDWNDATGRTEDEVVSAFKEASKLATGLSADAAASR